MTELFPDISFYQGQPDFALMKQRANYVILKSSQRSFTDPEFARNRAECERVGLNYGVYHFYDDRVSPGGQAAHFASLFVGHNKPVEIWCDWENTYNGPYTGIKNVVAFMEEVERLLSMEIGMYTGYYWFMEHSNAFTNYWQLAYLKKKKLWLAAYTSDFTNTGIIFVKTPRPWTKIDVWQYGTPSLGKYYGVDSIEIDMNERLTAFELPQSHAKLIFNETTYEAIT